MKEQCATIAVPLDYSRPAGRSITIAIDRFPASGPQPSLGVLLVNPGGPGGSGITLAREFAQMLPAPIRAQFDLVGFDPRGVGASAAVKCPRTHVNKTLPDAYTLTPDTDQQKQALIDEVKNAAADCKGGSGSILPYLGTENAARDIDAIRVALGQSRINFLGFSYGTVLGATYLSQYPDHVRAMVLDGVAEPTYATSAGMEAQTVGFADDIDDFIGWCVKQACPLGDDPQAAHDGLSNMLDDLGDTPQRTTLTLADSEFPRDLTADEAFDAVIGAMYTPATTWPVLKSALADEVNNADGTALLTLDDRFHERDDHGKSLSNIDMAGIAIGTRDPATPYAWAEAAAKQFPSSRLLTRDGDGHGSYLHGSSCVNSAVDDYLLTLALPATGTHCASAPVPTSN